MSFGVDKCAYINIERGKKVTLGETFSINNLELHELQDGENYTYLGQDEEVGFNSQLNKDKVTKEYFTRVKKIWKSELYAKNKVTAHNTFAVPVMTPTFGIIDWTKAELEQIDIKTRKMLSLSGSFHTNSDVDRLYAERKSGGRGLNSVVDQYITRTISIVRHLQIGRLSNRFLALVYAHEQKRQVRVASELTTALHVENGADTSPKELAAAVKNKLKANHLESWIKKPQHGYLYRSHQNVPQIDSINHHKWLTKGKFSSHVEGYICAIQEEEIYTNYMKHKREQNSPNASPKCRLCKSSNETIQHILAACPKLSASSYLPLRHNPVAKEIYMKLLEPATLEDKQQIPAIISNEDIELWWDQAVQTTPTLPHNKPDIILWNKPNHTCHIIDICVGLDVNITKNVKDKHDKYLPLAFSLKQLYPSYRFYVTPLVLGATGLITSDFRRNLESLGLHKDTCKDLTELCQKRALQGSVSIVKSTMKM